MKRYLSYVATGEPSMPSIPGHWQVLRVKDVGKALIGLTYGPEDVVDDADDGTLVLRAGNIQDGRLRLTDNVYVAKTVPDDLRLRPGDIVVCARNGSVRLVGKNAVATSEVAGQTWGAFMAVLRSEHNNYLRWVLNSQIFVAQTGMFSTATINQLTSGTLHNLRFAMPPPSEQRAVASFLDRETSRIDTLIDEQQRLIEMLRERRQAVIDESFSNLGEPGVQLRRYIEFLTSGSRGWGDYYADEGERFLRIGNLPRANLKVRGDIQFVDLPVDVTEGSRTMLQEGDLLFSITAYLGSVAVVEGDWVGAYVSQHVALCRLECDQADPRFIGWFMLTTIGQDQLNEGAAGGTKMQLALDDIRGLRVPMALIEQQRRIAAHLDRQTAKIDALIAETERFIELARERRTALITAAVTGQIDVREMA